MAQDALLDKETNQLFPVFLKLEDMRLLIVGGGALALEKLNAVLFNSLRTSITLVATEIHEDIRNLAEHHQTITLYKRLFEISDLNDCDVVIIAVEERSVREMIYKEAKDKGKLVNSVDSLEWCDFYLRSEDKLDEDANLLFSESEPAKLTESRWKRIASYFLFGLLVMFLGHLVWTYLPLQSALDGLIEVSLSLDKNFLWMIAAGFLAQLVDGALGMGYGVTSTTILLSLGVNLPAISGSVHTAEIFSSGISGYSHYKFGNVNKKLFKTMLIPGVLGAIGGAYLLVILGNQYASYIRPLLATYTLFLGAKIIRSVFKKDNLPTKVKRVGWLAGAGGFLDSFGGGGWGPLVTSTLISKGRSPKYVIGSVSITEFFVTLVSAITFFILLGVSHWQVIFGLIIGGTVAAPLAARLAGKLPIKTMFLCVGTLVIIWSLRILLKTFL